MKVSLCTTCLGRLHHLEQTLPDNVDALRHDPDVDFTIIAYGDAETWEWLRQAVIGFEIQGLAGRVRAFWAPEPKHWHVSKAKNLAHCAAHGEVLVNVDADNFVTPLYVNACRKVFADGPGQYVGVTMDRHASPGRIAIHRRDFYRLGGYSEAIGGAWCGDDQDFIRRASLAELYAALMPVDPHILHGHIERLARSDVSPEVLASEEAATAELQRQHDAGEVLLDETVRAGRCEANTDRPWAAELLIDTQLRPYSVTQVPARLVDVPARLQQYA